MLIRFAIAAACALGVAVAAAAIAGSRTPGEMNHLASADEGQLEVPRLSWRVAHLPTSLWASVAVRVFPSPSGGLCAVEDVPYEGRMRTCSPPQLLEGQLVRGSWGARQTPGNRSSEFSYAWIWGLADRKVHSLELVFADCKAVPLGLDEERFFLRVLRPVSSRPETWPHALVARDRTGRALEIDELRVAPPPTRAQPNRMRAGPSPESVCD